MAGFANDANLQEIMFCDNLDFTGVVPPVANFTADGQLPIGSTAAPHIRVSTLTAGAGIAITNAAGSITIASAGAGFTWNDVTVSPQLLAIESGYVTDNAGGITYTLPATAVFGSVIAIVGKAGLWTISQNANQSISLGASTTTLGVGGSLAATSAGDCIQIVAITGGASTVWRVYSSMGNITVT